MELSTLNCRVSYVPCLAQAVNVLAIRQVKQGTETARFHHIGFALHSCDMSICYLLINMYYCALFGCLPKQLFYRSMLKWNSLPVFIR